MNSSYNWRNLAYRDMLLHSMDCIITKLIMAARSQLQTVRWQQRDTEKYSTLLLFCSQAEFYTLKLRAVNLRLIDLF